MLETMMLFEEVLVVAATVELVLGVATLVAAVMLAAFSVVMSAAACRCRGGRDDGRCDQDHGRAHDRAQTEHDTSQIWNRSQVRCAPFPECPVTAADWENPAGRGLFHALMALTISCEPPPKLPRHRSEAYRP